MRESFFCWIFQILIFLQECSEMADTGERYPLLCAGFRILLYRRTKALPVRKVWRDTDGRKKI